MPTRYGLSAPVVFAALLGLAAQAIVPSAALAEGAKSPRVAAVLSLMLPGTGELYAGGRRSGRFFLFTEGLSWGGLFGFRALAASREATYASYAAAHAGAQTAGKSEAYFEQMAIYQSIYDRNARAVFRDGMAASLLEEVPGNIWEWESEEARQEFRDLRSRATSARQKAFLFVGALVFNRFTSALNAARIARKTQPPSGPPLEVGVLLDPHGGALARVRTTF